MTNNEYYTVSRWYGEGDYRQVVLLKHSDKKDEVVADFKSWKDAQNYIANRTAQDAN